MADKTVSVTALKYHTHAGKEHREGDTYDVPANQVELLVAQGMVKSTTAEPAPPAKASHPVEPITTQDFGITPQAPKK